MPDGRAGAVNLLVGSLFPHHGQGGEAGSAGNRVAVQSADLVDKGIVVGRSPVVNREDVRSPQHRRQWVTAAHDLAHGAHVRRNAVELLGAAVGQPEAGYHLVEYERDVVALGQVSQPLKEPWLGGDNPLDRFYDHRGDVVEVGVYDRLGSGQVVVRGDEHQLLDGLGNSSAAGHGLGVLDRSRRGETHHGVVAGAVKSPFKFEDLFFTGEGASGAHGVEAGVGAAGGETYLFGAGDGVDQHLGQFYRSFVGGEEGAAAFNRLDDGLGNSGVSVAQDHRAGPHQPVNVLVTADIEDMGAFTAGDKEIQVFGKNEVAAAAARQVTPCFIQ